MKTLPLQYQLRPELPNIYGTLDYHTFRETLMKMDELLIKGNVEHEFISQALHDYAAQQDLDVETFFNDQRAIRKYQQLKHALRCNIARHIVGESYRAFSLRLADSMLLQWFTGIQVFGDRKAISKSTLERYEKYFDGEQVKTAIYRLLNHFADQDNATEVGLTQGIDVTTALMDSTCVKAHIHFPTDWVLLKDAARSLLLAIKTIRAQGLKHRMIEPSVLLKDMNQLCIRMTHTRRRKESKKQRKAVLRTMKKLSHRIEQHAKRYRQLLLDSWTETSWSEAQMQAVIRRIDNILAQLPAAIQQAHERIIGGRQVTSADKLLSLYDHDVDIIVRGKAGSEVEFGQKLLLTEQQDGLIIDWELHAKAAPSDSQLLQPAILRMEKTFGAIQSISTDRGFASANNDSFLKEKHIYNATCPKSPAQLQEKLTDPIFSSLQTRRSQTESRIGIFKNVFLGKPLRSRILANKQHAVNWCVFAHNLWVLSRKAIADEQSIHKKAA